jgi:hypothetical protein
VSRPLLLFLFALIFAPSVAAQEETPAVILDPTQASSYWQIVVYAGPGTTFQQINILNPGIPVHIIERTRVGNWVHVIRQNDEGETVTDGWVMTGYLTLDPALRFSHIPVNAEVADADPSTIDSQSMQRLYGVPIMPTVSEAMQEVYEAGQALGNDPRAVTKIGDSVVANPLYLTPMSQSDYVLGPYDYLEDTIRYYGASTARESVAARIGLSTLVLFDPMWADKTLCRAGETPLGCEYRIKNPSVALIMFGPNDVKSMDTETYSTQMRQIVEQSVAEGVIPVLFTFSYDPDNDLWPQSMLFNLTLADIADEYSVPLVNLWSAARNITYNVNGTYGQYGLEKDHIHLTNWGSNTLKYSTRGTEAFYGVALYNLLSIRVLDEIRRTLNLE